MTWDIEWLCKVRHNLISDRGTSLGYVYHRQKDEGKSVVDDCGAKDRLNRYFRCVCSEKFKMGFKHGGKRGESRHTLKGGHTVKGLGETIIRI